MGCWWSWWKGPRLADKSAVRDESAPTVDRSFASLRMTMWRGMTPHTGGSDWFVNLHDRRSTPTYNGIFECFLGGFVSRLFLSISSAVISLGRVYLGSIISSIYPRAAAI